MRLISAIIRHYRIHHELRLDFDPSRTLIGGPNESGKSTFIEAIHRALFLRAKVTGDVQKSMVSTSSPGAPEVEVVFEVEGKRYQVAKRFSGNNGTTRLIEIGGATLSGEEAETRLAALLRVEAIGGGRGVGDRVVQQWAHLWVWQGQSGSDPTDHATAQRDGLLLRLQESGGAAAMQSALDAEVAAHFAGATEALFVRDRPRAGSELERAESATVLAETNFSAASDRVAKLRQAVTDYEDAGQVITRVEADLRSLSEQLSAVEVKQGRLAELRQQEAAQAADFQVVAGPCEALEKVHTQILGLRTRVKEREAALAPKHLAIDRLVEAWSELRSHADKAVRDYEAACDATRLRRLRHDLASAWTLRFERAARFDELSKKATQVQALEKSLAELRQQLAKLPEIDSAKIRKLQKLESESSRADATLNAMAANIDVVAAGQPVTLAGESVAPGESRLVLDDSELVIGQTTRIRIRPGGGTTLTEARKNAQDARHALTKALDAVGAASVVVAGELFALRVNLSTRIEAAETSLESLDAATLPNMVAEASDANAAAEAEVARRLESLPDFVAPTTLAATRKLLAEENPLLGSAESEERKAKSARDADGKKSTEAETALQEARREADLQGRELDSLRAQHALLLETHGSDEVRARQAAEALAARTRAEQTLSGTRRAITELQPDFLVSDQARLQRALSQAGSTKAGAETQRAVAQAALRSDGTDDPQAALALAQAQVSIAREHLASLRRKAAALRLLHQLFLDEQKALSERFTRPLAEKISGYLQCLFGPAALASVSLVENSFSGLTVFRPDKENGALHFDSLSGGAKEQVAAAVRLALAEVLAADHGGCLPVVFDDAFAYSDPDRVQTLQRMLDLAAARGLQIIVLTCTPSDYSALGAHVISLRAPRPPALGAVSPFKAADDSELDSMDVPVSAQVLVTDNQRDALLNAVQQAGGKAGNMSLRQGLGWSEETYEAVRDALVSSGRIIPGRGRGGSVLLPISAS